MSFPKVPPTRYWRLQRTRKQKLPTPGSEAWHRHVASAGFCWSQSAIGPGRECQEALPWEPLSKRTAIKGARFANSGQTAESPGVIHGLQPEYVTTAQRARIAVCRFNDVFLTRHPTPATRLLRFHVRTTRAVLSTQHWLLLLLWGVGGVIRIYTHTYDSAAEQAL